MRTVFLSCMALISLSLMSCSDDSDKIDDFFKEKIARLEENNAEVVELYANAVVFSPRDYWYIISDNKPLLEEKMAVGATSEWSSHDAQRYKHSAGYLYYYNLLPSTTYYYTKRTGYSWTQVSLSEEKDTYANIKSFTTPEFTPGQILYVSDYYVDIRFPALYIRRWESNYHDPEIGMEVSHQPNFQAGEGYRSSPSYILLDDDGYDYGHFDGLASNTTYYYRLYYVLYGERIYSTEGSFKTLPK